MKEINIIIQKDDYPQCSKLQFIEIEDAEGRPIEVGNWHEIKEDKWKIRITQEDWDKVIEP